MFGRTASNMLLLLPDVPLIVVSASRSKALIILQKEENLTQGLLAIEWTAFRELTKFKETAAGCKNKSYNWAAIQRSPNSPAFNTALCFSQNAATPYSYNYKGIGNKNVVRCWNWIYSHNIWMDKKRVNKLALILIRKMMKFKNTLNPQNTNAFRELKDIKQL